MLTNFNFVVKSFSYKSEVYRMNDVCNRALGFEKWAEVGYLPKLSTNLIAALPTLDVQNFSHSAVEGDQRTTDLIAVRTSDSGLHERFGF